MSQRASWEVAKILQVKCCWQRHETLKYEKKLSSCCSYCIVQHRNHQITRHKCPPFSTISIDLCCLLLSIYPQNQPFIRVTPVTFLSSTWSKDDHGGGSPMRAAGKVCSKLGSQVSRSLLMSQKWLENLGNPCYRWIKP